MNIENILKLNISDSYIFISIKSYCNRTIFAHNINFISTKRVVFILINKKLQNNLRKIVLVRWS